MCPRRVHFTDKPGQSGAARPKDGKKGKRVHSKSRDLMGRLIQDNGGLFGDSLYCRLCLIREQERENPGYSRQELWHLIKPFRPF